jgi:hypothetical protein
MPKRSSYLPGFFEEIQASPLSYQPRDRQVLFADAFVVRNIIRFKFSKLLNLTYIDQKNE